MDRIITLAAAAVLAMLVGCTQTGGAGGTGGIAVGAGRTSTVD